MDEKNRQCIEAYLPLAGWSSSAQDLSSAASSPDKHTRSCWRLSSTHRHQALPGNCTSQQWSKDL